MLKIRESQIQSFERAAVQSFELRTVEHLNGSFPKHCGILGDPGVREVILIGSEKAGGYKITTESGIWLYLDLMFLLGAGFDEDLLLPWAAEILKNERIKRESDRIERLHDRAMEYLDRVSGPNNEYIDEAQRRIGNFRLDSAPPSSTAEFYEYVIRKLNHIFPQKCEYLGELNLRRFVQRGIESAKSHGLAEERGWFVYLGLMFMLGSGFDADPLFGWAKDVLMDQDIVDPSVKVERLYGAAMNYLSQWCG